MCCPIGSHSIVAFDIWLDVLEEVLFKPGVAARLAILGPHIPAELLRGSHRHNDDHRIRLLSGDQIVQDEVRPADRGPRVVGASGSMQEIKDRVLFHPCLIARRGIDVHVPVPAQ